MKKIVLTLFLFSIAFGLRANHITGGTIYYTFDGMSNGNYTYTVTLLLYRDHNTPNGAQLDASAPISIFNRATNGQVWTGVIPQLDTTWLHLSSPDPCISNPPDIWYEVGRYRFTVTLPGNAAGYTIAYQRCCRITGINNLQNSSGVGATYVAEIPGTSTITTPAAPANNSARFVGKDTVVVCANNQFCYDFGAVDPDAGDSLAYTFCNAYTSGSQPPNPNPPAQPPYNTVPYQAPYDATRPLGNTVNLNPQTGQMCGIAPPPGIYVVTVCVSEYRNGILIATQRKDLQIKVGDCNLVDAALPASIPLCDDFTRTFSNQSPANALVHGYLWSFGDAASGANNTSNQAVPTHTFSDTGVYHIKLVINKGESCTDSATTIAYVFPGFFPNFNFQGICLNKPTLFFDSTKTVYGFVNSWSWDFGDGTTVLDTSPLQNPVYTYSQTGPHQVRLIVTSNKGCIDTVFKDVVIMDKPILNAIPKDTLICNGAQVVLNAVGIGSFSWTGPNVIANGGTANPTVKPSITSNYIVQLNDNGCINTDTVRVRVVDFVTLIAMADTVICATDSVQLTGFSNGLHYTWTPAGTIASPTKLTTKALPTTTTTYHITATIDHCVANDDVVVKLVPYPKANAGPDTTICFKSSAQLHATIAGSQFTWSPANTLNNANSLNPVATPFASQSYILTVRDTLGCPKPKRDTVVVTVTPKINAFAGNDTAVVIGQPLQFNATGGVGYEWSPATGLNHVDIHNPVGIYDGSFDSIIYKVIMYNELGCADSDYIKVVIFKTNPQIFVPTAFTPNGDGRNDVFRPIAVGISKFEYFRVYNRWGQLVFETKQVGRGWDGKIGGKDQSTETFVWVVKGVDFTGKQVFDKGTVTLIR